MLFHEILQEIPGTAYGIFVQDNRLLVPGGWLAEDGTLLSQNETIPLSIGKYQHKLIETAASLDLPLLGSMDTKKIYDRRFQIGAFVSRHPGLEEPRKKAAEGMFFCGIEEKRFYFLDLSSTRKISTENGQWCSEVNGDVEYFPPSHMTEMMMPIEHEYWRRRMPIAAVEEEELSLPAAAAAAVDAVVAKKKKTAH